MADGKIGEDDIYSHLLRLARRRCAFQKSSGVSLRSDVVYQAIHYNYKRGEAGQPGVKI